ncbi:MAG: amidohydrolase family protein [Cyclobacterium sp.]|uniref:amidohydrolase family protein n=1 Tax=Cyclobacterium sp. TaxID=1966343 RepID=UPI0039711701
MKILRRGMEYGMKPRLHADEIDTSGGSGVAAAIGALSVDHMNVPDRNDLSELADNKTVITLLPATNFLLKVKKMPPVEDMRRHGNIIAVSTDFNPGSSPVISLMLSATIGMINYSLLPVELIYAVTLNPAYSLELGETAGSVQAGRKANLLVHDIHNYKQLFYFFGMNTVKTVIIGDDIIESC